MRDLVLGDRAFYGELLRLGVPIAAQQLVMNALNAVDVLLIGQLGEAPVAAVGLANQFFFLLQLFLFGVGSGSAVFTAQYWGKQDLPGLHRVLGFALASALAGALLFSLAAVMAPRAVLGLYSRDPVVIAAGAEYLRIAGLGYIPTAITVVFGIALRSTRQVKLPMAVSISALSFKTGLAYVLIFGHLGFPSLGPQGAAIATAIARLLECITLVGAAYLWRLPLAARMRELTAWDRAFLSRFARTTLPVVINEVLWSLGVTTYAAIYARISTASIAAVNIAGTLEGIALVPFLGLGNACAIILGHRIGAGDSATAGRYARRFLVLSIAGGLLVGLGIGILAGPVMDAYRISVETQQYARSVLSVLAAALWLKAANLVMIVGIMRSGGDTRFALLADTAPLWFVGVPLALLGAFVLRLPVHWVVLMVMGDEATKFVIGLRRVLSKRWIHDILRS